MKKLICAALALCLAPAALAETGVKSNDFALTSALYRPGENLVLSPISLQYALGMAAEGANGATLDEILNYLGAAEASELAEKAPEGLVSANAGFVAPGVALNEDYIAAVNAGYAAEWFEMNQDAVAQVNDWVADKTDGLIDKLLSEAPDPMTGLILVNAVSMEQKWQFAFDPDDSFDDSFHAAAGDVDVRYMFQREWLDYVERDGTQMIRLPYLDSGLEMWVLLPAADGMQALLDVLKAEGLKGLTDGAEPTDVKLTLPKTDISFESSLVDALKALGVSAAFTDDADFSGISDVPMKIADILQRARLMIDEDGTRAAAATAMIMACMAAPLQDEPEPVNMRVDRPFAFAIADSESGRLLFTGVVENPTVA